MLSGVPAEHHNLFENERRGEITSGFILKLQMSRYNEAILDLTRHTLSSHFSDEIYDKCKTIDSEILQQFFTSALQQNIHKQQLTMAIIATIKKDLENLIPSYEASRQNLINCMFVDGDLDEIRKLLANNPPSIFIESLLDHCKNNPESDRRNQLYEFITEFSPSFIDIAIKNSDGVLLKKLGEVRGSELQGKINELNKEQSDEIKFLLSLSEEDCKLVTDLINQFSQRTFGKIKIDGALLTCAQIANRKSNFDPVILDEEGEFKEFLKELKETPGPHRERFIITGDHWISGDINITENGEVSILFLDSLGVFNIDAIKPTIIALGGTFPKAVMYVPELKRQHASKGCSAFALDDVKHLYTVEALFTVETSLESKSSVSGSKLHDYLADSARQLKTKECEVYLMKMPSSEKKCKKTDRRHLYLYQDEQDKKIFFMNAKGEKVFLEKDKKNMIPEPMKKKFRICAVSR